ncbi:MAG: four helix bundle protein [Patescibacteria group bacterium]|jgi:four helix bundle protein
MKYQLEGRVEKFSENIIDLIKKVRINITNKNIVSQLIRSATSIGANYFEANGSSSKKDFINKIAIAKKEAIETQYWLRMLNKTDDYLEEEIIKLWDEAKQIGMILSKIISNVRKTI